MGLDLVRLYRKLGGGGDPGWQCQGLERLKRWWRTEKAQKMKGQRFPSPMSTAKAITAGQLQFQEHLPTPEAEGDEGYVPTPCPGLGTFPSRYWFYPSPFSTPIHAAEGDLGGGVGVGTGCSFQVQELFLLPTSRPRAHSDQAPGNAVLCSFP